MKKLVSLEKIENNVAYLNDMETDNQYEVSLSDSEVTIYSEYLAEAERYETPDEETGVWIAFDDEPNEIEIIDNESELL